MQNWSPDTMYLNYSILDRYRTLIKYTRYEILDIGYWLLGIRYQILNNINVRYQNFRC